MLERWRNSVVRAHWWGLPRPISGSPPGLWSTGRCWPRGTGDISSGSRGYGSSISDPSPWFSDALVLVLVITIPAGRFRMARSAKRQGWGRTSGTANPGSVVRGPGRPAPLFPRLRPLRTHALHIHASTGTVRVAVQGHGIGGRIRRYQAAFRNGEGARC